MWMLVACSAATPPSEANAPATAATPPAALPAPAEPAPPPSLVEATAKQEIDYSCKTLVDCEIKNVGNCCGYYPACVNKDSPTFPEQVKADCAKEGRMAVCGFPVITSCDCLEGRCTNVTGPSASQDVK